MSPFFARTEGVARSCARLEPSGFYNESVPAPHIWQPPFQTLWKGEESLCTRFALRVRHFRGPKAFFCLHAWPRVYRQLTFFFMNLARRRLRFGTKLGSYMPESVQMFVQRSCVVFIENNKEKRVFSTHCSRLKMYKNFVCANASTFSRHSSCDS